MSTYRTKGGSTVTWTPSSALTVPIGTTGKFAQEVTASKWVCRGCHNHEGGEKTQIRGSGSTKWSETGPTEAEAQRHANQCTAR
ncbi:hypothetical protein ABT340_39795 [Streptosporangium sp. NPDC000239]|uniref:hypothetical protein n=1 Tax=Streptosporangium sp. NPDC000239 TaxID=3154248 RepID=UPI003325A9B2